MAAHRIDPGRIPERQSQVDGHPPVPEEMDRVRAGHRRNLRLIHQLGEPPRTLANRSQQLPLKPERIGHRAAPHRQRVDPRQHLPAPAVTTV